MAGARELFPMVGIDGGDKDRDDLCQEGASPGPRGRRPRAKCHGCSRLPDRRGQAENTTGMGSRGHGRNQQSLVERTECLGHFCKSFMKHLPSSK